MDAAISNQVEDHSRSDTICENGNEVASICLDSIMFEDIKLSIEEKIRYFEIVVFGELSIIDPVDGQHHHEQQLLEEVNQVFLLTNDGYLYIKCGVDQEEHKLFKIMTDMNVKINITRLSNRYLNIETFILHWLYLNVALLGEPMMCIFYPGGDWHFAKNNHELVILKSSLSLWICFLVGIGNYNPIKYVASDLGAFNRIHVHCCMFVRRGSLNHALLISYGSDRNSLKLPIAISRLKCLQTVEQTYSCHVLDIWSRMGVELVWMVFGQEVANLGCDHLDCFMNYWMLNALKLYPQWEHEEASFKYLCSSTIEFDDEKFDKTKKNVDDSESNSKLLHWDKVRASTDCKMARDHLLLNSFGKMVMDKTKLLLFSMIRFDIVKNITGLTKRYGKNERLRNMANLVIVGAFFEPSKSKDRAEAIEIEKMHILEDNDVLKRDGDSDIVRGSPWWIHKSERHFLGKKFDSNLSYKDKQKLMISHLMPDLKLERIQVRIVVKSCVAAGTVKK